MGYFFHKEDAEVVRIEGEAPRTLYTCIEPKTADTEHFSMGLEEIDPHSEIPWHSHADAEEIIFVFGGEGVGYVADEVADLKPGTVIYLPPTGGTPLCQHWRYAALDYVGPFASRLRDPNSGGKKSCRRVCWNGGF